MLPADLQDVNLHQFDLHLQPSVSEHLIPVDITLPTDCKYEEMHSFIDLDKPQDDNVVLKRESVIQYNPGLNESTSYSSPTYCHSSRDDTFHQQTDVSWSGHLWCSHSPSGGSNGPSHLVKLPPPSNVLLIMGTSFCSENTDKYNDVTSYQSQQDRFSPVQGYHTPSQSFHTTGTSIGYGDGTCDSEVAVVSSSTFDRVPALTSTVDRSPRHTYFSHTQSSISTVDEIQIHTYQPPHRAFSPSQPPVVDHGSPHVTSSMTRYDSTLRETSPSHIGNADSSCLPNPIHNGAMLQQRRTRRRKGDAHQKIGKLWQFLLALLHDKKHNPRVIRWENFNSGQFKFVQSDEVAKMWGSRKGFQTNMTYEKLSRAMRYYYKPGILKPVMKRRLVYAFGPNTVWTQAPDYTLN